MAPAGKRKRSLADWRSVRVWESDTRHLLRRKHALWFHGWCIGFLVLALMWAASHLQMVLGSQSLALRYLVTLGVGYLGFLVVLRLWAGALVGEEAPLDAAAEVADEALPEALDAAADLAGQALARTGRAVAEAAIRSGGAGDFGGGGAQAAFQWASDAGSAVGDAVGDAAGSVVGEVAGGAIDAIGSSDDGAIVVVPVIAIFLIVGAIVLGAGSLVLLYFGFDALLAVAVELAFGYASARTAVRVAREGWLMAAVRLTWKPLLGALGCAVLLGGLIDYFIPAANSLPAAIRMILG